jgi:lipoyl(octanoyl) transferase
VSFRLIVHPKMEGRLDMAIDEALAEAVGRGESPPVFRLYGFSPATLSLGRFQKIKGCYEPALLAADGVTLVRRPTGGHAVLHDAELTYSVALSKEASGPLIDNARIRPPSGVGARKREVYEFIARVLLAGLANLGITGTINAAQRGDPHNPDCFGSAGEYEIAGRDGRKLIGSAQMTTRTAILQHGSIPQENPGLRVFRYIHADARRAADSHADVPRDGHPPTCLDEERGSPVSFAEVRDAFARAVRAQLGAEDSELRPSEKIEAERILAEKYATDDWNLRY